MKNQPLILVVDDEKNFLEIVSAKLVAAAFRVETAMSQVEAVMKAENLVPDLILMDINMPGATGTDTALALKQNSKTKNTRIVFLSNLKEPWTGFAGDDREKMSR